MTIAWYEIPGWCDFTDVYAAAVARAPQTGARFVEVGTLFGQSAVCMASLIAASGKAIQFDTIDFHDLNDPVAPVPYAACGVLPMFQPDFEAALIAKSGNFRSTFNHFLQASGHAARVTPVILRDVVAVGAYANDSLDLVYLDANGTYDETTLSLVAWQTKIKPGGMLAGHDYVSSPEVRRAVADVLGGGAFTVHENSFCWIR